MTTGNGPPRSGKVIKVVVLPSLVAMSICWSIMGVSSCVVIPVPAEARGTIARKPGHDKAKGHRVGLNRTLEPWPLDRHCHAGDDQISSGPERFEMTQTSNRFFDEIGRLMNDAAGAAQGVKREVDTVMRNQA